jgi:hypothetical protein
MARVLDPFRCVLITVAGWMNQRQMDVIDYLREENRVLREQLGQLYFHEPGRADGDLAQDPRRSMLGLFVGASGGIAQ